MKYLPGIISLWLCLPFHNAWAIVNVSDLHLQEPKEGFTAYVDFKLDGTGGNSNSRDIALGSRLQWYKDSRMDYLLMDYTDSAANGSSFSREGLIHYRHIVPIGNRLDREWFLQGEYKPFADLASRKLIGLGLRRSLAYAPKHHRVYLGMSAMYESETRLSVSSIENLWRGNFYLIMTWQPREGMSFSSSSYLQPALDNLLDLHILEQLTIKIKVNTRTALVVNMDIRGDSTPPAGVKGWDTKYGTRIEYKL